MIVVLAPSAQSRYAPPLSEIDWRGLLQLHVPVALIVSPATVLDAETEHVPDVFVVAPELLVVPEE